MGGQAMRIRMALSAATVAVVLLVGCGENGKNGKSVPIAQDQQQAELKESRARATCSVYALAIKKGGYEGARAWDLQMEADKKENLGEYPPDLESVFARANMLGDEPTEAAKLEATSTGVALREACAKRGVDLTNG
jgi:hypothetical protein